MHDNDAVLKLDVETLEVSGEVAYGSLTAGHGVHELASSGEYGWSHMV
ncbi:hypothetical protein Misp01_77930 [Microtetraspora sp. NBRC 13810]|nr:hypothetical protein [Microtetraspora sp. NBRC 13810]GLW12665.1 hypothetical protein Misp01_77930 [Microtetraspora sp. NBRC 13810]